MEDFLAQLARELKNAAAKPNVLSYVPNSPVHEEFHKSTKVGRILIGGNRSGKSVAGTVESVRRATGSHPYYATHDVPTRGRIVTVDKDAGINQIIIPLLKQWIPASELKNSSWEKSYNASGKVLTLRNGSTIELKTHQQEVESFAGVPLHWVWFDEEPPHAIFNECRMRLIDFNGCWYMTMTPVQGQDWIFERFINAKQKNVEMFEVGINDNPHLNKQALELLDDDLDEDEKKVRRQGLFVPKGGLILKEFDITRHVIEAKGHIPAKWSIYVSIDHGFNAPSAILWHAVSPSGDVVTFQEIYVSKVVVSELCKRIKLVNTLLGREPVLYVGDPSMSQRNGVTGTSVLDEYRRHGIPLMQGKKNVDGRINKMNEYLKYDKWHITEQCPNTIKEARAYAYMTFESAKVADRNNVREAPKKKNDHSMDSCGYFFNLMPYINAQESNNANPFVSKTKTNMEDFPWDVDSNLYSTASYELGFGEV